MKGNIAVRALAGGVLLMACSGLALAEVSVQLNRDGSFGKVVFLSRGGRTPLVWRQVRPYLPLEVQLNPLGDTLGDLRPTIASHPVTGLPWVFWSRNVANIRQLVYSTWTAAGWSAPRAIGGDPAPSPHDELDPAVAFDAAGAPFLVWWQKAAAGEVYFSTLIGNVWTPRLLLSRAGEDSRTPSIRVDGTRAVVTYHTPRGAVTTVHETAVLIESAASLMDSPTPPGLQEPGGGDEGKNDPSGGNGPFIKN